MLVDWKYVYKRRNWTSILILSSLEDKSWESFKGYFKERKIVCPPKEEFNNAIALSKISKNNVNSSVGNENHVDVSKPKTKRKPSNKTGRVKK